MGILHSASSGNRTKYCARAPLEHPKSALLDDCNIQADQQPHLWSLEVEGGKHAENGKAYTGSILVDRTPPTKPVVSSDSSDWVNRQVEYTLNGTIWQKYVSPVVVNSEGITSFEAKIVDMVGNESDVVITEVKIDKTPPSTPVVTISKDGWATSDVTVTV